MAKKKPQGDYPRGREGNEALSYSRSEASAERSIKRKQRKHKARKPRARSRGFIRSCRSKGERKGTRGDKSRRAPRCIPPNNKRARLRQTRHAERKQRWSLRSWGPHPRFLESHRQRFGRDCGALLVCFSWFYRASIARRKPRGFPRGLPRKIQAPTKCFRPVPWAGINTDRIPLRAPGQPRQTEQGVPFRSEAHNVSKE